MNPPPIGQALNALLHFRYAAQYFHRTWLTDEQLLSNIRRCPECNSLAPLVLWDCLGCDEPGDENKLMCLNCGGFVVPEMLKQEPEPAEPECDDLPLFAGRRK